jgi:hypothetical protein
MERSQSVRQALRRFSQLALRGGYQLVMATLLVQLAFPQLALMAQEAPSSDEATAGSAPGDDRTYALAKEVQSGRVHAARDFDFLGPQGIRWNRKNGEFQNTTLLTGTLQRPPVALSDFDRQINVSIKDADENGKSESELVFAIGVKEQETGTFVSTMEHFVPGIRTIGPLIKDDGFITFISADAEGRAQSIRMISKDMFVGSSGIPGSGFASQIPAVKALDLSFVPANWTVKGLEVWSAGLSNPETYYYWDGFKAVASSEFLGVGDKLLVVENENGLEMKLWIPNEDLGNGFIQRLFALTLVALQDEGGYSEDEIKMLTEFLQAAHSDQKEVLEARKAMMTEILSQIRPGTSSDLSVAALRTMNFPWITSHLDRKVNTKNGRREPSALEGLLFAQRQRYSADPAPTSEWSATRKTVQGALERNPELKVDSRTSSWGQVLLEEQARLEAPMKELRTNAFQRVIARMGQFAKRTLTPTRTLFLGTLLGIPAVTYSLDTEPTKALAAVGTRIIEMSKGTPVENVIAPVTALAEFTANNVMAGPEGYWKIGSWVGGVALATSTFFLIQLAAWGVGLAQGSRVPARWNAISKDALTRLSHFYCFLQRPLQQGALGFLSPSFYRHIYNTGSTRGAFQALSRRSRANEVADRIDQRRLAESKMRANASRLAGLVLAAEMEGVSPELLALAENDETEMRGLLMRLQSDPHKQGELIRLRASINRALVSLYEVGHNDVADPELIKVNFNHYLVMAQDLKKSASRTELGFLRNLRRSSVAWASKRLSSIFTFGLETVLGIASGKASLQNGSRDLPDEVVKMQTGMALVDFSISNASSASIAPSQWSIPSELSLDALRNNSMAVLTTGDQAFAWTTIPQSDLLNVLAGQSQMNNPYGPIASLAFAEGLDGVVHRVQTLEEGLLAILKGMTNPDPKSPGFFKSWLGYMRSALEGHQVRAVLLGASIFSGFMFAGHHTVLNAIPLALTAAYFVAFRKIGASVSWAGGTAAPEASDPGYAVVWPFANTSVKWANDPVDKNRKAATTAAGLLASPVEAESTKGVIAAKALFAEGQGWFRAALPSHLNVSSKAYTPAMRAELLALLKTSLSAPTAHNPFIELNANLLAAVASVVLYYVMYDGLLGKEDLTVAEVLESVGWAAKNFTLTGAGVWVLSKVSPVAAHATTPVKTALGASTGYVKQCVNALLGIQPINLE